MLLLLLLNVAIIVIAANVIVIVLNVVVFGVLVVVVAVVVLLSLPMILPQDSVGAMSVRRAPRAIPPPRPTYLSPGKEREKR